jgi:penicillin-binding protein 1A
VNSVKRPPLRLLRLAVVGAVGLCCLGIFGFACAYVYIAPSLPTAESMRRVELQVPLRVYTRTGGLISQIGEQRRIPVTFDEIPPLVWHAVISAEDDRFFQHHGVDWIGVLRAMAVNLASGDRAQGASTITMQAARNMFLTLDKTWRRKLQEVFVTYRMEKDFTKQEILSTYLNVIFFGQRSYGIAAAAETYYGKSLSQLTVSEAATLAGIIQVPSRYNPISSPSLAHVRRTYVLRRMQELGYIDAATARAANSEPIVARGYAPLNDVEAPYVAELARQEIVNRFGPAAVNYGYKVITTIDGRLQAAANRAVRVGLIEYDRRHGYRGPVARAKLPTTLDPASLDTLLGSREPVGLLQPAVVLSVAPTSARVHVRGLGTAQIDWDGMSWARPAHGTAPAGPPPKKATDILGRGDIVYVVTDRAGHAQLAQIPEAQSALVALDPEDGAVVSLVGGFDYYLKQFNRATQAKRQPGSGFKPFLYSAALENGLTPASIILDTPVIEEGPGIEGSWRPENSGNEGFGGPMRMREALVHSRNLVSIRILRSVGIAPVKAYASRFGFEPDVMPDNLTLALGTLPATPLQMATGYAAFANGGYKVNPYLIERIENAAGKILYQAAPTVVCHDCNTSSVPAAAITGEVVEAAPADPAAAPEQTLPPLPSPSPEQLAARVADAPAHLKDLSAMAYTAPVLDPKRSAPRIISAQNDWIMTSIMGDVIRHGTGIRAMALGRGDLAGKTGTTNQSRDAWFNGFTTHLVGTVWVGFDEERSLGETEEGSRTAVPIWVHFMREALKGVPERPRPMPPGVVALHVSSRNGSLVNPADPDAMTEYFMVTHLPNGISADKLDAPPPPVQQNTGAAGEGIF